MATALSLLLAPPVSGQTPNNVQEPPGLAVRLVDRSPGFPTPTEVTVELSGAAHVAVFRLSTGVGAEMLHPSGRGGGTALPAGRHTLRLRLQGDTGGPSPDVLDAAGLPHHVLSSLLRPRLLVIASEKPLWLAGLYHGRRFVPRTSFASSLSLTVELLDRVLSRPGMVDWGYDLHPPVRVREGHPFFIVPGGGLYGAAFSGW